MDEIEENYPAAQDTTETIQSIDVRLGPEENRIKEIISQEFTNRAGEQKGDDRMFERTASVQIKTKLDDEFGGNWNIIVGEVFVSCLGLLAQDRFGHFRFTNYHILVFETSSERA